MRYINLVWPSSFRFCQRGNLSLGQVLFCLNINCFFLSIASTLSTSGQAQSPSVLEEKTNCWVRQCLLYFMVILFYFFIFF